MKTISNKKLKNIFLVITLLLATLYVFYSVVTLIPISGVKKLGMCMHSASSIEKSNEIRNFIIKTAKSMDLKVDDLSNSNIYSGSGSDFIFINLTDQGFLNLNEIKIEVNSIRRGSHMTVYGSIDDDLYRKNIKFIDKHIKIIEMLRHRFGFVTYPESSWGGCMPLPKN